MAKKELSDIVIDIAIKGMEGSLTVEEHQKFVEQIGYINKKEEDRKYKYIIKTEFDECLKNDFGNFYYYFYAKCKIEPQYKFRFAYLCSYLDYKNNLGKITEKDLKNILQLSERETLNTKKVLTENKLIIINKDKTISVKKSVAKKGSLKGMQKVDFTRIFNNGIKELYENSNPREHKKIALLLEILPYVNYKYNILCRNPQEQERDNLDIINITELCEIVGYNPKNTSRLKKDLFAIKINNEDAFKMVIGGSGNFFITNPRLNYKGNSNEGVKWLQDIFTIRKCK